MPINYWQNIEEGSIYHIYNHASGNRDLFLEEKDYEKFLSGLRKYFLHIFDVHAYCLMPNHFHFVVKVKSHIQIINSIKGIGSNAELKYVNGAIDLNKYCDDQFRRWFSGYALYLNKRYKIKGQLFQKRIKKVSVDEEKKLTYLICYLHHNPIHHGFEKEYGSWKYCSYLNYASIDQNLCLQEIVLVGEKEEMIKTHNEFKINYANDLNLD